ncbi:MAG: MmgE/PrpD family protein [Deltaproteobacteria bacterium]|nr:MmgE/PrpD family protein [Deltaproteobacteria bacterium]
MQASNPLNELCRFLSRASLERLPSATVKQARRVLIDTAGVMVAGAAQAEVGACAEKLSRGVHEGGTVICPGRTEAFAPLDAALVGGMAGSSLEYEEGNARAMGHPAVQMVPALLAEAQELDATGERLLLALIAGYETASRVSRASTMRKGLHPTGTWGVVGCAVGVGLLHERSSSDLEALAHLSASYAFSPYVKNSFAGWNAASTFAALTNHLGILSNVFLDAGLRADPGAFEMTFSRLLSEGFEPETLSRGPGDPFAIEENYFKPYPTCRFTHPALEALKAALGGETVTPGEVERITVHSFGAAVHSGGRPPANAEALRFSVPYLLAVLMHRGGVGLDVLDDDLIREESVRELAARVDLVLSDDYEAMRPERSPARVTLSLRDGRELTGEVLDCLGDPPNPMADGELRRKFLFLTENTLSGRQARSFLDGLEVLHEVPSVRSWIRMLKPEEAAA